MNTVHIAGHLGRDPETRVTPSGQKLTSLVVATNVYQNGKDETIWWRVTFWGDDSKNKIAHLKKGSAVIIVGEFRTKPEIYNNKEGQPQVNLSITGISIHFNPFGRSDRQNAEQRPAGAQGHAPVQGGHDSSFGEPEFLSSATGSFGGVPQHNSGHGSFPGSNDNDGMPF